jgi:hypothetical protein
LNYDERNRVDYSVAFTAWVAAAITQQIIENCVRLSDVELAGEPDGLRLFAKIKLRLLAPAT